MYDVNKIIELGLAFPSRRMCVPQSLNSSCGSLRLVSLRCPPEDVLDPWLPTECSCEDWSDCADAQADLSLRWVRMQACGKCYAQLILLYLCTVCTYFFFRGNTVQFISTCRGNSLSVDLIQKALNNITGSEMAALFPVPLQGVQKSQTQQTTKSPGSNKVFIIEKLFPFQRLAFPLLPFRIWSVPFYLLPFNAYHSG